MQNIALLAAKEEAQQYRAGAIRALKSLKALAVSCGVVRANTLNLLSSLIFRLELAFSRSKPFHKNARLTQQQVKGFFTSSTAVPPSTSLFSCAREKLDDSSSVCAWIRPALTSAVCSKKKTKRKITSDTCLNLQSKKNTGALLSAWRQSLGLSESGLVS